VILRNLFLAASFAALGWSSRAAPVVVSDICVYGGTSGGVAAAVAAARLGKSVVLLTQNNHVGGMTASGLGVTDVGPGNDTSYIGGLAREFYRRVGQAYGSTNLVIWFEPHVAENVFWQMLAEAGVNVYSNRWLASVTLTNQRLAEITMEDGSVFRAREFIDTTYEGDLMAAAGVTFTWGREGTNVYNESLAGIRPLGGSYNYDPYVVPGNPASGLLPLVQPDTGGNVGDGDLRLQAYNFRLCLTQNATNQIPIAAPTNYSEANYELVRRYIAARVARDTNVSLGQLIHIQTIIPNGKTDINANGELSTDYVGYNDTWATNTHAGREQIRAAHENYIRGLLYFYRTSTNVPANLNAEAQSWGLAKDEFTDHGGWPWQIYVREARRMVSDYVMTQSNCEARATAPDGIGLARYNIDSHGVRRLASGGFARWEGSIGGTPPYPYPISYRSIVPRAGEGENLFCTFALSASHVAFASCRMEPVFMMTSHAAGVAAAFALDDNVAAQQLNYAKLAAQLRADGQLLAWNAGSSATNGVILDEDDPGGVSNSGGWVYGANAGGWNGDYYHDGSSGKGTKWVRYTPALPTNGAYEVYAWWVEASNRATNAPYDILHDAGTNRVLVNQKTPSGGWFKLLTTNFTAGQGQGVIIRNDNTAAGTYVIADAVRFLPVGSAAPPPPLPKVEVVASDADAGEFGPNPGRFAIVRKDDTNLLALTVSFAMGGTASNAVDYALVPGNVTLAAGAMATNVFITPMADDAVEGDETVTLTLLASPDYALTSLSNATVLLHDRPVDAWRRTHFSTGELADPAISGDLADPDQDGLANLLEYALGLDPKTADASPLSARIESGQFTLTYARSQTAPDVVLVLETSADLVHWSADPAQFAPLASVDAGAVERITVRLVTPPAPGDPTFVRLRVTKL
jgi:hypothetical protein